MQKHFKQPKSKKCWCGSGKKAKNCHGLRVSLNNNRPPQPTPTPAKPAASTSATTKAWGVPGEEHKVIVVPVYKGQTALPNPVESAQREGDFKVQFLLSRPGYRISAEREHKFIDEVVGDSHLLITKPKAQRDPLRDADRTLLQAMGPHGRIDFIGLPNDHGYLGKFIAERVHAKGWNEAENIAFDALSPFLSAWSLHLDIPINIETIQVTDLQSQAAMLRVNTPHFAMTFAGGQSPFLSNEFLKFASIYREAMVTNSAFYRFLCLYKIFESIAFRRAQLAKEAKANSQPVRSFDESVPATTDDLIKLLHRVYPWQTGFNDALANEQLLPAEAIGKRFSQIRDIHLQPLRNGIAHALLRSGDIKVIADDLATIRQVNKWLPFCRIWVRLQLLNEFPTEFSFKMNPEMVGITMQPPTS